MSWATACSITAANSVYLSIFFLQASSAVSSCCSVSPMKYSILVYPKAISHRIISCLLKSVFPSLYCSVRSKLPHSHIFVRCDKMSAGVLTFEHTNLTSWENMLQCSKSWAAVRYAVCYKSCLLHSLLYRPTFILLLSSNLSIKLLLFSSIQAAVFLINSSVEVFSMSTEHTNLTQLKVLP